MIKTEAIVKRGYWFFEDRSLRTIQVIKQNWDFYYKEGSDGEPQLNEEGEAFYVLYDTDEEGGYARRSRTCLSLEEVLQLAREEAGDSLRWKRE